MPRSTSLCSQQSGQAPNFPVPPLPFELSAKKKPQQMKSPSDMSLQRVSGMSLLSGDTSVLNDTMSRGFSEAGTDFTSISLASPPPAHLAPVGLGITDGSNAIWNFSRVDRSASPISPGLSKTRPPLSQQHSFRGSIHNSLPRNQSSGLSMSLLDRSFPTPEAARKRPTKALEFPDNDIEGKLTRRPNGLRASLVSGSNVFQISEDAKKAKRASTSVLNTISGNQTSPIKNPYVDRPTSIATDDPFRWDSKTSMQQSSSKPSAMKNGAKEHKRQSCVRISNIPIVIPSEFPGHSAARLKGRQPSISPFPSPLSGLFLNQRDSRSTPEPGSSRPLSTSTSKKSPHPPSTQTFNPQLPKHTPNQSTTSSHNNNHTQNPESPYSPTFSMIPLYTSPSPSPSPPRPNPKTQSQTSLSPTSSSSSTTSTPSHRPAPAPAARNPNRRRAVFGSSSLWPPLLSSSITPLDPPTIPSPPPLKKQASQNAANGPKSGDEEDRQNHAGQFLFNFPSPPLFPSSFSSSHQLTLHPTNPPNPPTTTSPPRGPRPLPNRHRSPSRIAKSTQSSSRLSPSPRNRSRSPQKPDLLRKSILELRRMNSEARVGGEGEEGRRGRRRWLSLGFDEEGGILEEDGWEEVRGDKWGGGLVTPERKTARGGKGIGMVEMTTQRNSVIKQF
ncbi:MAG: hypothetical protein LQ350_007094 [Teloschistes chrysophthalmus]|nr:MAG: hypothetical protein LQ350_007094 [Niorma chrysophthalma]